MSKYDYEPEMHVFDCSNPYPIPGGQCDCVRGASEGCECLDDNCHHHHHRCPPCPPCPPPYPYPIFPPCPPPLPVTTPCSLYLETPTGTAGIASGGIIILPLISNTGSCLSYNALTGQITILTSGIYYFDWNVNADSTSTTDNDVVITLEQSTGAVVGISGATASAADATVLVSGSTVVSLTAGNIITLNNSTGVAIDTVAVTGEFNFAASLSVMRIV